MGGKEHKERTEIGSQMSDLSIIKTQQELNTDTAQSEIASAFLRSLASYVPSIGPFLAQVIGVVIPNQKMDRLVAFARVLGDRIKYLEDDIVKLRTETPEFTDLLEDGLVQASRALTDEQHCSQLVLRMKNWPIWKKRNSCGFWEN